MKLVLASQGFTIPEIAVAVATLAGKSPEQLNVAIINEAYIGNEAGRDQRWLINELALIEKYAKGSLAFVNLRAYSLEEVKQRLEFANVIYIVGGKQLVLPELFKTTGFDKLLTEMAQDKIILGTSAGANILGCHIDNPNYWQDQYGSAAEYLAQPTLGLVDFNILPHYGREDNPRRTAEIVTPLLKDCPFPLYGVTDTQAVIYDEGTISFVGGEPVKFGKA